MKNCILINSYPNNDHRQNLLREQIKLLKSINLPIILCSGCEIPNDIVKEVNYVVINKNKRIKTDLFQKKKDGTVCGYIKNTSNNLSFNGKVKSNRSCDKLINFGPGYWHMTTNLQFGDWVSIEIVDSNGISYNKKIIYDSEDKILALEYY